MFALGIYRNYDELEESLSLEELMETYKAIFEREHRHNKFLAALQGHDLDKGQDAQLYGGNEKLPDAATVAGGMMDFVGGQAVVVDTGTGRQKVQISDDDYAARLARLEAYGKN